MPTPIMLAHKLARRLSTLRRAGTHDYLRPDGKSQVSVRYADGKPISVETVVISTQHSPDVTLERIREEMIQDVILPTIPAHLIDAKRITYHINPTGRFVTGGPMGDTGLTGRKIIVDTYGGAEPVSIMVDTFGTGKVPTVKLEQMIRQHFDFTPAGIIKYLNLRRPIYKQTAAYRHFGRSEPEFTWERTDRVTDLRADAGI